MENVQVKITNRKYTKPQLSMMFKSMLIAGIGFLLIALGSYGFAVLFNKQLPGYSTTGLGIYLLMLILSLVVSMLWSANMYKMGSWPLTMTCFVLYILMWSVGFGWLFSLGFGQNLKWLPVIFAVAGGMFILTYFIAKIMSINGVVTFGKIIGATTIAMTFIMLIFMIIMIVFLIKPTEGTAIAANALMAIIMMGMSLISFLYIIIDLWRIQKMAQFGDETELKNKITPFLFGYQLLTDLVNIVFWMVFYAIGFKK